MTIRTYQPGDEAAQVSIYNEAAASLPGFKPATSEDVVRRVRARDFDPAARLYAIEGGQPVGYASFHPSGRVSFPWCRRGHEQHAEPLFAGMLEALRASGMTKAFAAYRADWTDQKDFFLGHGFQKARDMVNYILDPAEMPTPAVKRTYPAYPVTKADIPAIVELAPQTLRSKSPEELEKHLLQNPYFPPEQVFLVRGRTESEVIGVAVLVLSPTYADPAKVDSAMPCYRLGAFGSEGLTAKRINGLFSFLAKDNRDFVPLGLDLLGHAAVRLMHVDAQWFAAQVPSDVPHLHRFYEQFFRRQGSFPVFERSL